MTPNVATSEGRTRMVMGDPRLKTAMDELRRIKKHVEDNAENVGRRFPEEARKIHYEEAEKRSIYGEASPEEVHALSEEGVEVHPMPRLPEDAN